MKFVPDIRAARNGDEHYLYDIDIKCFEHTWLPDEWGILWESEAANVMVACYYGTPIGFLAWERHVHNDQPALHMYKVAVKPVYRGNNVGKHMLAYAYEVANHFKLRYLTIPVPLSMTIGDPPKNCVGWLVGKMNFQADKIVEAKECLYGSDEDVILFVKDMP